MWRRASMFTLNTFKRLYSGTTASDLSELSRQTLQEIDENQNNEQDKVNVNKIRLDGHLSDVVKLLLQNSVSKKCVVHAFSDNPALATIPVADWDKRIRLLVDEGGLKSEEAAGALLEMGSELLRKAPETIANSFENLRRLGFTQNSLRELTRSSPQMLTIQPSQLTSRFQALMATFTHSDVIRMAPGSPNILLDDWNLLTLRIHYILFRMGVDQMQIVRSRALSHPLGHIKLRHRFLLLAGKFKKPDPKKKLVFRPNSKLSDITDTTDEYFSKNVAQLSVEEYTVFKKLCSSKQYSVEDWDDDDEDDDGEDG